MPIIVCVAKLNAPTTTVFPRFQLIYLAILSPGGKRRVKIRVSSQLEGGSCLPCHPRGGGGGGRGGDRVAHVSNTMQEEEEGGLRSIAILLKRGKAGNSGLQGKNGKRKKTDLTISHNFIDKKKI